MSDSPSQWSHDPGDRFGGKSHKLEALETVQASDLPRPPLAPIRERDTRRFRLTRSDNGGALMITLSATVLAINRSTACTRSLGRRP
jgi:hypothetical protein